VKPAELRVRGESGQIVSRIDTSSPVAGVFESAPFGGRGGRRARAYDDLTRPRRSLRTFEVDPFTLAHEGRERELREVRGTRPNQPLAVFPYGVSRTYLEQAVRELRLPVRIQHHVDDADTVLTLKNYYRRKDSPVRAAESTGIPIQVLRSNTVAQIKGALARVYGVDVGDPTEVALQEATEAITRVLQTHQTVELAPQNAYVRRLQHKLVEEHELTARSTGSEPNRRLRILGPGDEEEV
jgi:hypothetical protein